MVLLSLHSCLFSDPLLKVRKKGEKKGRGRGKRYHVQDNGLGRASNARAHNSPAFYSYSSSSSSSSSSGGNRFQPPIS